MKTNYWKEGERNALCDVCGVKFKSNELSKRWDGFMVCKPDFEYRHPQDYIRGPRAEKAPAWTRPEPTDRFVTVPYISESVGNQSSTLPTGNNHGDL